MENYRFNTVQNDCQPTMTIAKSFKGKAFSPVAKLYQPQCNWEVTLLGSDPDAMC